MLIALVAVDFAFILVHILAGIAVRAHLIAEVPDILRVTSDLSLPEDFNYLKWGLITISLIWLAIRDRWWPPFLWAIVFAMILLDDSFQLHEWLGHEVSVEASLASNAYLFADDMGEIAVFGLMGLTVVAIMATSFTRKGSLARKLGLRYATIIGGLALFGVGIDAMHQMIAHLVEGGWLETVLPQLTGVFEDGGEMVVGSLALALTLAADPIAPLAVPEPSES